MSRSIRLALALFMLSGIAGPIAAQADTLTSNFTLTPTMGPSGGTGSFTVTTFDSIPITGLQTFTTSFPTSFSLDSLHFEIGGHDFSLANRIAVIDPTVTLLNGDLVGIVYAGTIIEQNNFFTIFVGGLDYSYIDGLTPTNNTVGTITASPAPVPLPPSIISQFIGLCLLSLLGWWRKRKLAAAA